MALADFWEIKDNQVLNGKAVLNVYQVKRIQSDADAVDVGQAFIKTILQDELLAIQVDDLSRTTIDVANLGTPTDFTSIDSSTLPGQRNGEWFAGFNVAGIQFNRTRNDMKNGQKRFTVGVETDSANGVWIAAFLTSLTDLRDAVLSNWEQVSAPGVDVCEFVVMKRFCIVPAQDPCVAYRLPNTSAEADANHYVPTAGVVRVNQRSQVSRKVLELVRLLEHT